MKGCKIKRRAADGCQRSGIAFLRVRGCLLGDIYTLCAAEILRWAASVRRITGEMLWDPTSETLKERGALLSQALSFVSLQM